MSHPIFTKEIYFYIPMTFKKWNCNKTKTLIILQKLLLHSLKNWKLIHVRHIYVFNIVLPSNLTLPMDYCDFGLLKRAFTSYKPTHDWWILVSSENDKQFTWKFYKKHFYHGKHSSFIIHDRFIIQKPGYPKKKNIKKISLYILNI